VIAAPTAAEASARPFDSKRREERDGDRVDAEIDRRQAGDDDQRAGGGEPSRLATPHRRDADDEAEDARRESEESAALSHDRGRAEAEEAEVGRARRFGG
jgi:hypothetical protein